MHKYLNAATDDLAGSAVITLDNDEKFKLGNLRVEQITLSDHGTYRVAGFIDHQFQEREFDYPVNSPIVPKAIRDEIIKVDQDLHVTLWDGRPTVSPVQAVPTPDASPEQLAQWAKDSGPQQPAQAPSPLRAVPDASPEQLDQWAIQSGGGEISDQFNTVDSTAQIVDDIRNGVAADVLPLNRNADWNNTRVPTRAEQLWAADHPTTDPVNWGWKGNPEPPAPSAQAGYGTVNDRDFLAGLPAEVQTEPQTAQVQATMKDYGVPAGERARSSWEAQMARNNPTPVNQGELAASMARHPSAHIRLPH